MNIALETIDVWEIEGKFDASALFMAIPLICAETDILAIGSDDPSDEEQEWLLTHEIPVNRRDNYRPFDAWCYDGINREEIPFGKAYALHPKSEQLQELSRMARRASERSPKKWFFEHVLAYREGKPLLPLMDYHDAFLGGSLCLSGLFSEEEAQRFAQSMGANAKRIHNPVIDPWPFEETTE